MDRYSAICGIPADWIMSILAGADSAPLQAKAALAGYNTIFFPY